MILLFIGTPLTFAKLVGYIISRFNFFAQLAGESVVGRCQTRIVKDRFAHALRQYDLPISCTDKEYHMNETKGLFFLRNWYSSLPCGLVRDSYIKNQPFRFLDLEAELRNTIYEMVPAFPRTGIRINRTPDIVGRYYSRRVEDRVTVVSRDMKQQCSFSEWLQAVGNVSASREGP